MPPKISKDSLVDADEATPDGGGAPLDIWNGDGNWTGNPSDWSTGSAPPAKDEAEIQSGVATLTTTASVNSVVVDPGAQLNVAQAGALTTGALLNLGELTVNSAGGDGGGSVKINGVLTNQGSIVIGNSTMTTSTTVTVAGLDNTGSINLWGNETLGTKNQATLNITGAAPSALTGAIYVHGDSDLEFASGGITSIAYGATLQLDGAQARVSIGAGKTNSALTGLSSNAGLFDLEGDWSTGPGGISVTTNTGFVNTGTLEVDIYNADGASSLTIGGTLTNSGTIAIGNNTLSAPSTVTAAGLNNTGLIKLWGNQTVGTSEQATLDITGAAPTTLTGSVILYNDTDLEFGSGGITSIAFGGYLEQDGAQARISIGAANTSTALSKLSSNAGTIRLLSNNGAYGAGATALTTTTNLTNSGALQIDIEGGNGGTDLTIGGTLTNSGTITIGNDNLGASTTVTATRLNNTGSILLWGNDTLGTSDQATLDITGAAPTTLTASVILYNDTDLEFGSGGITSIAAGGYLEQDGAQARISIGAVSTSTALSKLGRNEGTIRLLSNNGAYGAGATAVTTTTSFTNSGAVQIDIYGGDGGTNLTIGGTLNNSGSLTVGNDNLSASTTVTAAQLNNTGSILLWGNDTVGTSDQATLDITKAAPTILTGSVILYNDTDLEFGSGGITTIAAGAYLEQDGAQARVSIGAGSTSTALSKLASNAGTIRLLSNNGAYGAGATAVTTKTDFGNSGAVQIDIYGGDGGTDLGIGGTLTNSGTITIGTTGLGTATTVTATGLANSGGITVYGSGGALAELSVSGAITEAGGLYIGGGAEMAATGVFTQTAGTTTIAGTLSAASFVQTAGSTNITGALVASTIDAEGGLVDIATALSKGDGVGALDIFSVGALELGAADSSHTVTFENQSGTLDLEAPASFAGTIAGFTGNDVIDLLNTSVTKLSYSGSGSSGVLTVSNAGGVVATLAFSGKYTTANFVAVSDGHGGTDIVDPAGGKTGSPLAVASPSAFIAAMAGLGAGLGVGHAVGVRDLASGQSLVLARPGAVHAA